MRQRRRDPKEGKKGKFKSTDRDHLEKITERTFVKNSPMPGFTRGRFRRGQKGEGTGQEKHFPLSGKIHCVLKEL